MNHVLVKEENGVISIFFDNEGWRV